MIMTKQTALIIRLGNGWTADGEHMPSNIYRTRKKAERYARKLGYACRRANDCDADGPEYQYDENQFDDKAEK